MIGPGHAPFVIAEMSGNHNGDIDRAFALMRAAKLAGADAVKLQTYTADTITLDSDAPEFLIKGGLWDGRKLYELYQEASTPWEWHEALFDYAKSLDLIAFSTPFDATAVDFLEELKVPAYKIASFELIDLPLISKVARTGKPMIMSTGMAGRDEIDEAIATAREAGCQDLVLLHCISAYPAPAGDAHLRTIPDMARTWPVHVGLSDHTMGTAVSIAAIALGACVIEKHFTLDRADGGPDSGFSLNKGELADLCQSVRTAYDALGAAQYGSSASEKDNLIFRRSLYVVQDIGQGDELTEHNVRSIRPGNGLPPKLLPIILGRRAAINLPRGTPLQLDHIADG